MGLVLSQCILEPMNHILRDRVTMSAVFASATQDDVGTAALAKGRWTAFFNSAATGGAAVGTYISAAIDRTANACRVRSYSLTDLSIAGANLGSPISEDLWTMSARASGATDFPDEVSIVCSFHATTTNVAEESVTGRPAARRRGRFFLGPLASAGEIQADGMLHVKAAVVSQLVAQCKRFAEKPATGTDDAIMQVWSRKDAAVRPVIAGFVDNEFDTQRRRGLKATARSTFTVAN